jgi:hypothetical protein
MKLSKQEKQRRREQRKKLKVTVVQAVERTSPQIAKPKKRVNFLLTTKRISVVILFIIALITFYFTFITQNLSQKERYYKDNVFEGDLQPDKLHPVTDSVYSVLENPPIFTQPIKGDTLPTVKGLLMRNEKSNSIILFVGGCATFLDKSILRKGIKFKLPVISKNHFGQISLGIKDDRVYTSVEFKDIITENTAGYLEYNHWKVFSYNTLEYPKNDDNRLEVRDKQNNIIFSIKYELDDKLNEFIFINGYFLEPKNGITILAWNRDTHLKEMDTSFLCSDANWKENAYKLIPCIKTIFP